jgi:hypothetical protein
MSQRVQRRPLTAALLSFVQPGVGHLYLREWTRAVLWAALWLGSLGLVVSTVGLELTATETVAAVAGVFALVEGFPTEAVASMVAVAAFATLDAYWLAARNNHRLAGDVGTCPHCGKELDPTLDFCHWCTASLESEESA